MTELGTDFEDAVDICPDCILPFLKQHCSKCIGMIIILD